jgi:hypothetical protein
MAALRFCRSTWIHPFGRIPAITALWMLTVGAAAPRLQGTTDAVWLTLSRRSGYPSGLCRLSVNAFKSGGTASLGCGISLDALAAIGPSAENSRERRRTLTPAESLELRRLYDAARLFQGRFEGADRTGSDGTFEVLIVRGLRAVVVVTSGNGSFEAGARKRLMDWFRRQEKVLRELPISAEAR